jgi:hypothetical protein
MMIPVVYDLFGPQPGSGNGFSFTPGTEFAELTAFTANTKSFYFDRATPHIEYAVWRAVWLPTEVHRARLRWHHNDENGMNFTDMGEIIPAVTGGPIPSAVDITIPLRQARASGLYVHVGQSFKGDGVAPLVLYEAHLMIHWRVGYYGEEQ